MAFTTKITYLILCHINPNQVAFLINHLGRSSANSFVVHIDKASNPRNFEAAVINELMDPSRVYFTKSNINVKWGGVSFLYAIKELIHTAFDKALCFDYLSLISVQCFPVKTNQEISDALKANWGYSFVEMNPYTEIGNKYNRLNRYYFYDYYAKDYNKSQLLNLPGRIVTKIAPKRNVPFTPYWGRVWWFLWKEHALEILQSMTDNNEIYRFLKYSLLPEEIFFASLIKNSSFESKVISKRTTFADYSHPHPQEISPETAYTLRRSEYFFGRKFYWGSKGLEEILKLLEDKE